MKTPIFHNAILTLSLIISFNSYSYSQDLPGASSNLMTAPAGSIVIPMDNTHQATSGGIFNIRAYGFIVHLMNHSYHPKWIISAGKVKDGIDFTVAAERLLPTNQAAASRDFRAGPMIFFPADTAAIYSMLENFNAGLPVGQKVNMYRTTADVTVDVRYDLWRIPRVGILNDGNNTGIHTTYMTNASVPTANYTITAGVNLINNCFTFVSEPHVGTAGPFIDSIRAFVLRGGNFLAQCDAILTYENAAGGRFQNSIGMAINNVAANPTTTFPNGDMAYAQIHGTYSPNQGGSIRTWDPAPGSVHQNNYYSVVANSAYPNLSGASVSKLKTGNGGLVFFLGNHNFDNTASQSEMNGVRMYLNAMLIPSGFNCNYAVWYVLPVEILQFDAHKSANGVDINWKVAEENRELRYFIERSTDGRNFAALKRMDVQGNAGVNSYSWTDASPAKGNNYYRLRIESGENDRKYSQIKQVWINFSEVNISLYPNPSSASITIGLADHLDRIAKIVIYDNSGRLINQVEGKGAISKIELNTSKYPNGIYAVQVFTSGGKQYQSSFTVIQNQ